MPANDAVVPGGTTGAYSFNDAFNNSQQFAHSSSGSHSGPDIYTATLGLSDYNNAISDARARHDEIVQGYLGNVAGLNPYVSSIANGYGNLNAQVQNQLTGAEGSARQDLADQFRMATGASRNNLISSGLGNSTASLYAQRGLEADRAKAALGIANQFAQMRAGYLGQYGTGALNAQQQAMGIYGQLGTNFLSTLGSQQTPRYQALPNVTQSNANSSSGGTTIGGSTGGSSSQTLPSVVHLSNQSGITANQPPANPFLTNNSPFTPFGGQNPFAGTTAYSNVPPLSVYHPDG